MLIIYLIMIVFGYLSTLSDTPQIIMTRKLIPGLKHDYAQIIACLCLIVVMIVNNIVNFMPFRENLFQLMNGRGKKQMTNLW